MKVDIENSNSIQIITTPIESNTKEIFEQNETASINESNISKVDENIVESKVDIVNENSEEISTETILSIENQNIQINEESLKNESISNITDERIEGENLDEKINSEDKNNLEDKPEEKIEEKTEIVTNVEPVENEKKRKADETIELLNESPSKKACLTL
jgi:hypothetical protein